MEFTPLSIFRIVVDLGIKNFQIKSIDKAIYEVTLECDDVLFQKAKEAIGNFRSAKSCVTFIKS